MRKFLFTALFLTLTVVIFTTSVFSQIVQGNNSIGGYVFDASTRRPVPDVYVELLNDVYAALSRTKTDSSGRYGFRGLTSGAFKVKVIPYGTNYLEEVQDVRLESFVIGGNRATTDNVYLDLYLRLDKRKANLYEASMLGSIFVQEVPEAAKNTYKEGIEQLAKSSTDASPSLETLKKSLTIFPNYYDALLRIGLEYTKNGDYAEALPFLVRAVKVNQRSFSGFYLLGLSEYNLKQYKESSEAFYSAINITPQFIDTYVKYGMVLRIDGRYDEAEKNLLKAASLSKDSPISEINWQLALLYDKTQRYNEAADQLEKYLKIEKEAKNSKQIKMLISQMRAKAKN